MQSKVSQLQSTTVSAVNTAIDKVKSEVNGIVDTIDNLSAQMCESQCTSFFNLPCFLLFRCTDKIRNFCLAIVLPIVIIIITAIGCSTGLFSFPCCCKAIMCLTGLTCLFWVFKLKKEKAEEEAKEGKEKDGKEGKDGKAGKKGKDGQAGQAGKREKRKETPNPEEEECPQTEKNMHVRDEL
jgi:hypothetical protein